MIRRTVSLIVLALLASLTPAARADGAAGVETGEINGAPFRIEIPEDWQGGLFVYVHGYELAGTVHDLGSARMDALRAVFLERGYAVVQSAYARQGWAVKEAMEDTEAVRRYFVAHHGAASTTLVGGHSMGGFLTLMLLERYPDVYDGGLSFCGPLLPSLEFFGEHIFDILAAFEYFARDVEPHLSDPTDPDAPQLTQEGVAAALADAGDAATILAHRFRIRAEDLPMAVVFSQIILKELVDRAGGMPVDSENTVYAGFGDDPAFNRGVRRYHADAAAREYLWRYATPTGRLADPMLALHTSYDPLVPPWTLSRYATQTEIVGTDELYRQMWVAADGHCKFSMPQTGAAFDALLSWIAGGEPPPAGELRTQVSGAAQHNGTQ